MVQVGAICESPNWNSFRIIRVLDDVLSASQSFDATRRLQQFRRQVNEKSKKEEREKRISGTLSWNGNRCASQPGHIQSIGSLSVRNAFV